MWVANLRATKHPMSLAILLMRLKSTGPLLNVAGFLIPSVQSVYVTGSRRMHWFSGGGDGGVAEAVAGTLSVFVGVALS